jgi:hypothetical protein
LRQRILSGVAAALLILAGLTALRASAGNLHEQSFDPPLSVEPGTAVSISGRNQTAADRTLVVRLDDGRSVDYASRVNLERVLPPGEFRLRIPVRGLHTPSGRPIDADDIRLLMIFPGQGDGDIELDSVAFVTAEQLPGGAVGWDLGPRNGVLAEGFEFLTAAYEGLQGQNLRAVDRGRRGAAPDPLLSDGIAGIDRLELPLSDGRWRIALWTRDLGEWEYLPHPLWRIIRADGVEVHAERYSPMEWIQDVYLDGHDREVLDDSDPWKSLGRRRGGLVQFETEVSGGRLVLALEGDGPSGTYLAGIFAEPAGEKEAWSVVQEKRAQRFRSDWRIGRTVTRPADLHLDFAHDQESDLETTLTAAPGTGTGLEILVSGIEKVAKPDLVVLPPSLGERRFPTEMRFGHRRYGRPNAASTLLVADDNHLRGDLAGLRLYPEQDRRLHLRVEVPEDAEPGVYRGEIQIGAGAQNRIGRFAVRVLPVQLPSAVRPIGVYLEETPPLTWFPDLRLQRAEQLRCDLETLGRLGLTGIAPPLPTPVPGNEQDFVDSLKRVHQSAFIRRVFSYTSVKRLVTELGIEAAADQIARVESLISRKGVNAPVWAIADEPSQPGRKAADPRPLSGALRAVSPTSRLAGQLNNPRDKALLDSFEVALVNAAFGADERDLAELRRKGIEPWLYNMEQPRLAAGFYLWRVNAAGYLQWHARMPTADPFDPTDGREGDIQFLYPTSEICPPVPDVDRDLLRIADGITDLRWLLWLDQQAAHEPAAQKLLEELSTAIPERWDEASNLTDRDLVWLRQQITELVADKGPGASG